MRTKKIHNVRNLWRAVIMQALIDATNKSQNRRAKCHKKQAKQWLDGEKCHDFSETCILAEMEPEYVQMKVNKLLKNK